MVKVNRLHAGYPGVSVLRDLTLSIPPERLTVIAGPNGCGKSTLLKTICGIVPVSGGEITIQGRSIQTFRPRMLSQQVSYLAQGRSVPDMTAGHLVLHGRFPYLSYPRRYRPQDRELARQAMEQMGISALADHPLSTLSGGTRQKVYLAMALAQDTPIVLLDEPTTYLDAAHQLQCLEQARFLCRQGKTVVMVLHDLPQALRVADHLVVLHEGRTQLQGTPEEVFTSGCLSHVFGVPLERVSTPDGWLYYYSPRL